MKIHLTISFVIFKHTNNRLCLDPIPTFVSSENKDTRPSPTLPISQQSLSSTSLLQTRIHVHKLCS